MQNPANQRGDHRDDADALFLEFLSAWGRGEHVDLEALCLAHPAAADALRSRHGDWRAALAALSPSAPTAAGAVPKSRWSERLRHLRARSGARARYAIEGEIGAGGMGVVYRAFDPDMRRHVALKEIRPGAEGPDRDTAEAALGRFLEEAQVASQLDHPAIVPVYELGADERDRPYFTMKLVRGESLERVIEHVHDPGRSDWTLARALAVVLRVCEAASFAHAKGVVHRDLKPANVMVGEFGEVYVMDWGIARVLQSAAAPDPRYPPVQSDRRTQAGSAALTLHGDVIGTPAYMAPEQAQGEIARIGPAADVFAVGAILAHLVSGSAPAGRRGEPVELLAGRRGVPAELRSIVERAAAADIDDRYSSMTALAADLRAFLEDRVVSAHQSGLLARLRKWLRRNRALSLASAAAIAAVAIGLAGIAGERARTAAEELLRADLARCDFFPAQSDELWPSRPEIAPRIEAGVRDLEQFLGRLPLHRAALAASAAEGAAGPAASERVRALERVVGFLEGSGERSAPSILRDLERRLAAARSIEQQSVLDHADAWSAAIRSIGDLRESPRYGGLALQPQLGLVPLGRDPESGLFEFWHVASGERPARDAPSGRIRVGPTSGIVLVLIPAGSFPMGEAADQEWKRPFPAASFAHESPVRAVALDAYFIAKHELTRGQWLAVAGEDPAPGTSESDAAEALALPVCNVSWRDCERILKRLDLVLPTEAQWERAARADTATSWWMSDDGFQLQGVANLADAAAIRSGLGLRGAMDWLDDGYAQHAPVDALRPNPFGLHHVYGNVWEWCQDAFTPYAADPRPRDGLRTAPRTRERVARGGAYLNVAVDARSANRDARLPEYATPAFGVRPARAVEP